MQRVQLILGEDRGVREGLSDVLQFEVRKVGDDFRRRHAVRDEIYDVRDRNAEAADSGPAREKVRILRDSIELCCHVVPSLGIVAWAIGCERSSSGTSPEPRIHRPPQLIGVAAATITAGAQRDPLLVTAPLRGRQLSLSE